MATYVLSDLHGCNKIFNKFLSSVDFSPADVLYIVGDILDRGNNPVGIYETIRKMGNIILLKGNHELMFANYYREKYLSDKRTSFNKLTYFSNGGVATVDDIADFCATNNLDQEQYMRDMYDFIMDLPLYKKLDITGRKYILVHAGITGKTRIEDESEEDLLWIRHPFFNLGIKGDTTYIFGHTPCLMLNKDKSLDPWFAINKIGIDGGLAIGEEKGQLNVLNLDTQEVIVVTMNYENRKFKFKKSGE